MTAPKPQGNPVADAIGNEAREKFAALYPRKGFLSTSAETNARRYYIAGYIHGRLSAPKDKP